MPVSGRVAVTDYPGTIRDVASCNRHLAAHDVARLSFAPAGRGHFTRTPRRRATLRSALRA